MCERLPHQATQAAAPYLVNTSLPRRGGKTTALWVSCEMVKADPCVKSFYCEQDCSTEIDLSTVLFTPIGPDVPLLELAQTSPVFEP
jgi:hypothetical protein